MRHVMFHLGLGAVLLTGCNSWKNMHGTGPLAGGGGRLTSETPTADALVSYLNDNAQRLQTIDCGLLDLQCRQGIRQVGLRGWLVCQKPRNFRMGADVMGNRAVDMGSNDQEFWYWISKADPPYLFHCSYTDFEQGRARMVLPFQPSYLLEALGMGEYGPVENYQVTTRGNTVELIAEDVSPTGQRIQKVTVFSRAPARNGSPQVIAHIIRDASGKEICGAYIKEIQQDRVSGAILPRRVNLVWPAEQLELQLKLDEVMVNQQFDAQRTARLFSRPNLPNVPAYDLARGVDRPTSIRRVGGVMR